MAASELQTLGGVPTIHFVVIWRLGVGTAALHHLLPSLLHHPVQATEVLQHTHTGAMYNRPARMEQVTYEERVSIEL